MKDLTIVPGLISINLAHGSKNKGKIVEEAMRYTILICYSLLVILSLTEIFLTEGALKNYLIADSSAGVENIYLTMFPLDISQIVLSLITCYTLLIYSAF